MDPYFNNPALRESFTQLGQQGQQASDAYLQQALSYNPMDSIRSTATGLFEEFKRKFGKDMRSLRGNQVARGRLDTGYGMQDEDELFTESSDRLNTQLLQTTMQGEQMRATNMGQLGAFGQNAGQEYRGGIADLEATQRAQALTNKASKRQMWGQLGGAALGAAGMVLGGPAGGAIGGMVGRQFSDETLKVDVEDEAPVLPRVRRLRGRSWKWNDEGKALTGDGDRRRRGVMAQNVAEEFPDLVARDPASGKLQIDYGTLASTLVAGLGELAAEVDELKVGRAGAALAGR
jgi:hypothetical protein